MAISTIFYCSRAVEHPLSIRSKQGSARLYRTRHRHTCSLACFDRKEHRVSAKERADCEECAPCPELIPECLAFLHEARVDFKRNEGGIIFWDKPRLDYFFTSPFYLHFGGATSLNEQRRRGQIEARQTGPHHLASDSICLHSPPACKDPSASEFVLLAANEDAKEGGFGRGTPRQRMTKLCVAFAFLLADLTCPAFGRPSGDLCLRHSKTFNCSSRSLLRYLRLPGLQVGVVSIHLYMGKPLVPFEATRFSVSRVFQKERQDRNIQL